MATVDLKFFASQGIPVISFPGIGLVAGVIQIGEGIQQTLGLTDVQGKRLTNPVKLSIPENEPNPLPPVSATTPAENLNPTDPIVNPRGNPEYEFAIEPIVTVSQKNNIIMSTPVQGDSSIKEYWSFNDFQIQINGVLVAGVERVNVFSAVREALRGNIPGVESDEEMEERLNNQIKDLENFLKAKRELKVDSPYLNQRFGIFHLAILNVNFPHTPSGTVQKFEINAISDNPNSRIILNETERPNTEI